MLHSEEVWSVPLGHAMDACMDCGDPCSSCRARCDADGLGSAARCMHGTVNAFEGLDWLLV